MIMSTAANTSTNTADDLGVPISGEMANARAVDNNASSATSERPNIDLAKLI